MRQEVDHVHRVTGNPRHVTGEDKVDSPGLDQSSGSVEPVRAPGMLRRVANQFNRNSIPVDETQDLDQFLALPAGFDE
jgi:hypothetical protein